MDTGVPPTVTGFGSRRTFSCSWGRSKGVRLCAGSVGVDHGVYQTVGRPRTRLLFPFRACNPSGFKFRSRWCRPTGDIRLVHWTDPGKG